MSSGRQLNYAYEDYLRVEENSQVRHEYLAGEVYAMAGGSPEHGALAFRVGRLLSDGLTGCTPLSSDVRIHVSATGLTTYPDVSFVRGPAEQPLIDRLAVSNPSVIVEVTSPSTEAYDRGSKLTHYQQLPSVRAVVFVSHRESRVTVVERGADGGWNAAEFRSGTTAALSFRSASFSVDALYEVLTALR